MRIYLDVSSLNRPFDDQRQPRIRLESEAITMILERFDNRRWRHVSSQMVEIEIRAMSDARRRARVARLLPRRTDRISLSDRIVARASEIGQLGLKPVDAVHVAAAEMIKADVLLSCDDRLCRVARKLRTRLRVRVVNPLDWMQENESAPDA